MHRELPEASDSTTFLPAVRRLRTDFGIGWITALKNVAIRALVEQGHLQPGLFDERNLLESWRPRLIFADTDQQAKLTRDPVAPAKRSRAALAKAASKRLDDNTPAHSFGTLLAELATFKPGD